MIMTSLNWHKSKLRGKRKRRQASRKTAQPGTIMASGSALRVGHLFDRGNTVATIVGLSGRRNF